MRKNFGAKPWTYPQPVFIVATYDEAGHPDAMNAAWGGIDYDDQLNLCLSAEHKTVKNLLASRAFTVSMGTADQLTACDYVGIVSGNKVPDKVERAGFHTVKSEFVNAPLIEELPMAVECELISRRAIWWAKSSTSLPMNASWTRRARSTRPSCAPSYSTRYTTTTWR